MDASDYSLRLARADDQPALESLIERSARELSRGDYSEEQVSAALAGAFGVDSQLVRDGTYFVLTITHEGVEQIVAAGGWSYRKALFGGDALASSFGGSHSQDPHQVLSDSRLDPSRDPAKIRAFFVDPVHARKGLGRRLLAACEGAAREHGFRRTELMATLPGQRLYLATGYQPGEPIEYSLREDLTIRFVPMSKVLVAEE